MITPDIAALEKWKSKSKDKRENVLNVLKNLESNVNGFYFHHNNVSMCHKKQGLKKLSKRE